MILKGFLTRSKNKSFACVRFGFLFFLFFNMLILSNPSLGQRLKQAIGHYDCTSNSQCHENQYCDIDSHVCVDKNPEPACNADLCDLEEICPVTEPPVVETCPLPDTCGADEYFSLAQKKCVKREANCNYILDDTCVECISNKDCNTGKPICDKNHKCVDCATVNATKPSWTGSICEACPADKRKWDADKKECVVPTCTSNADCNDDEYCRTDKSYSCSQEFGDTYLSGICRNTKNDIEMTRNGTQKAFIQNLGHASISSINMTWRSADRFCERLGMRQIQLSDFQCKHRFCRSGCDSLGGICHKEGSGLSPADKGDIAPVIEDLQIAFRNNVYAWVGTVYDECHVFSLDFIDGQINGDDNITEMYGNQALCVGE